MAGLDRKLLARAILARLLQDAFLRVQKQSFSKTLKESMSKILLSDTEGSLYVPHYWAIYYHEGSGPISGKNMVFFKEKTDDPRTDFATNYPVRTTDVRHLTKDEFRAARKAGKIVVTTKVGKRGGVPFFTRALTGFGATGGPADKIASATLTEFLVSVVPTETRILTVRL